MGLGIEHVKHTRARPIRETALPVVLVESGTGAIDDTEGITVGDTDLRWTDTDDRAVSPVQRVNVVNAAAGDDGQFQREIRKAGMQRTGNSPKGTGECCVNFLYEIKHLKSFIGGNGVTDNDYP